MKLLTTSKALKKEFERLMHSYSYFDWAVAWASVNFETFDLLKKYRAKIRHLIIGTHFNQTHPRFISEFMGDRGVNFRVDKEGRNGVFHPKVFLFSNNEFVWEAVIGSSNFTNAAFGRNFECGVLLGSDDKTDGVDYRSLVKHVDELWNGGRQFKMDELAAYEEIWHTSQKYLSRAKEQSPEDLRGGSVSESELLHLDWADFFERMQKEPENRFQDRITLLAETRNIFDSKKSLCHMTPVERERISGTAAEDSVKWRLFGSMAGAGRFRKMVKENVRRISDALDQIPGKGVINKNHFDGYVEEIRALGNGFQGLAVPTRLLCIKRPDVFICIDGPNRQGLAKGLGVSASKLKIDNYWNEVIEPIRKSPWYQSQVPVDSNEKDAWCGRVALVDALFYDPKPKTL